MRIRKLTITLALLILVTSSCINHNTSQEVIYDFSVRNDEENALRIIAEWKTLEPASSKIEYRELENSESWLSTPLFDEEKMDHRVVVACLRANTEYNLRPVSNDVTGSELVASTKELPDNLPKAKLVIKDPEMENFFTIGGFPCPINTIVAVNIDGEIIWYHMDSDQGDPQDFHVSSQDGRLIYNTLDAIKAVAYDGTEEVLLDIESFGEVCHHDFLITSEGNYMYLTRITIFRDGKQWCADEIVERNAAGNEIWRWKSAEYAEELGGLEAHNIWQEYYEKECGLDWTHSNSIDIEVDQEGNKFVLLSIRNMNRVINPTT